MPSREEKVEPLPQGSLFRGFLAQKHLLLGLRTDWRGLGKGYEDYGGTGERREEGEGQRTRANG